MKRLLLALVLAVPVLAQSPQFPPCVQKQSGSVRACLSVRDTATAALTPLAVVNVAITEFAEGTEYLTIKVRYRDARGNQKFSVQIVDVTVDEHSALMDQVFGMRDRHYASFSLLGSVIDVTIQEHRYERVLEL